MPGALLSSTAALAEPTSEQKLAVGLHDIEAPMMGVSGNGSVFLVHTSADRRTALALTSAHSDPRAGDRVRIVTEGAAAQGAVSRVIAQSQRLDYSLVSLRLDTPLATRPLAVVGDHLPGAGPVSTAGWVRNLREMVMDTDSRELARRPRLTRVRYPESPQRGIRDAVPLGVLNPMLLFTPFGGMPISLAPGRAPIVTRVTVAGFPLQGGPGMSGGPVLDAAGRATAIISGGDRRTTFAVPTALVVRDVARRADQLWGESRTLVRDWLRTAPPRARRSYDPLAAPDPRGHDGPSFAWAAHAGCREEPVFAVSLHSGYLRASRKARR